MQVSACSFSCRRSCCCDENTRSNKGRPVNQSSGSFFSSTNPADHTHATPVQVQQAFPRHPSAVCHPAGWRGPSTHLRGSVNNFNSILKFFIRFSDRKSIFSSLSDGVGLSWHPTNKLLMETFCNWEALSSGEDINAAFPWFYDTSFSHLWYNKPDRPKET